MLGELGFPVQANSNFVDVKMGGGGGGKGGGEGGLRSSFYFGRKKNPCDVVGQHSTILQKLVILCYLNNLVLCSRRVSSGSDSKLSP